jgi:RNA polymerase primary sigma factor
VKKQHTRAKPRGVDPSTTDKDYGSDVVLFMMTLRSKLDHQGRDPSLATAADYVEVAEELGYTRVPNMAASRWKRAQNKRRRNRRPDLARRVEELKRSLAYYKGRTGRLFPTLSEVWARLYWLGYRQSPGITDGYGSAGPGRCAVHSAERYRNVPSTNGKAVPDAEGNSGDPNPVSEDTDEEGQAGSEILAEMLHGIPDDEVEQVRGSLEVYLLDINEVPLLTRQQEIDLSARIAKRDPGARQHMIRANLRLVVNIARGYIRKGLALVDLIQEGNLGVIRAAEGYDGSLGWKFSTYASYWIKQSIKRALTNTSRTIRFPAYMVELHYQWQHAATELEERLGRPPTHEEIRRKLKISKKKVLMVVESMQISTHSSTTKDGADALDARAHGTPPPDEIYAQADLIVHVRKKLGEFDERDQLVVRMRFGLDEFEGQTFTLKEIGERVGVTRERVRQIEKELLDKLRRAFDDKD